MSLQAGTRLGPYQILSALGAGGMGEVYRARDTRLKRDVAIKVLPEAFVRDPERLARFQREAELLAALNHQNIASIYGLEEADSARGLILELVEGPTLADRLKTGPLSLLETLTIARQIADALDAAHRQGIVHRDLKPANIKITPAGSIKVLDFGLAKSVEASENPDLSHSPTVTIEHTREGVILGTAAYMSPEQARGLPVNKATDIWSFGCVLFEMLTGHRPFPGHTISDAIASILTREPDWSKLPSTTPEVVRSILERCLEKDLRQRVSDIADVRSEFDQVLATRSPAPMRSRPATSRTAVSTPGATNRSLRRVGLAAAALLLVAGSVVLFMSRQKAAPAPLEPPLQLTDFNDSAFHPALSPDGRMLTFIRGGDFGDSNVRGQIYVKLLPKGEPVQLTRDQPLKEQPVFSPDGSRIVYTSVPNGFKWDAWQVPVLGGAPQPFLPNASGLTWIDDHQLLYSEIMSGVHMGIVSSTDSRADRREVYLPPLEGGMAHRSALSPDHKSLLLVEMDGGGWLPCRLMPFDASSIGRPVGPPDAQCTSASWSPDGRWMYFSSNAGGGFHVWRQRYPDGKPEQITTGPAEQEGTTLSVDGRYLITSIGFQQATISIHTDQEDRSLTSEGFAMLPTMTADGARIFYLVRNSGARAYASGELWSMDLASGNKEQVLPGRIMGSYAISNDGKKVVFTTSGNEGGDGVWIADVDRRTPPRQLTRGGEFRAFFGAPGEIVYLTQGQVRYLYKMKEDGTGNERVSPDPLVNLISISPDGRWVSALVPEAAGGTSIRLVSTAGEPSFPVCGAGCTIGFGPNRVKAPILNWSADGTWLYIALQYFGQRTGKTVVLPYRSNVPLTRLWPNGLTIEADVPANPGARVINERDVFPASTGSAYLYWRRTTQSNLYRIAIPEER